MDPANGRWWMNFGSYWSGILQIELDSTTGKVVNIGTLDDPTYSIVIARRGHVVTHEENLVEACAMFYKGIKVLK